MKMINTFMFSTTIKNVHRNTTLKKKEKKKTIALTCKRPLWPHTFDTALIFVINIYNTFNKTQ